MPHLLPQIRRARSITAIAALLLPLLVSVTPASAQARTYHLGQLESACRIHSSAYNCSRASQQARARYGNVVTIYQWNSAVGVVRNWVRQGK